MTWLDDLLPASLGGIPLHYRSVDTDAGRRTFLHEFYGDSREAFVEDIGPVTKRATIDVFLIGPTYNQQRDLLIDLLNTKGPHEFIHPLRGSMMVRLGSPAKLSESVAEGGMVRIGQLDLIKAGDAFPLVAADTGPKLVAMSFEVAALLAANTTLDASNAIDPVRTSIVDALRNAVARLRKANGRVAAQLNRVNSLSTSIQQFDDQIETLLNTPAALFSTLAELALSVFGIIRKFEPLARTIEVEEPVWPVVATASAAVNDLASFTTAPMFAAWVPEGPQQELAEESHAEIQSQTQAIGYVAGAGIAGSLPYASASEVGTMLQTLSSGLAAAMAAPGIVFEVRQSIAALRASTIRVLLDRQAQLPRVARFGVGATMPAVVLAWELYGDANRVTDLVLRNGIANPNYVPAGTELEVLVDA